MNLSSDTELDQSRHQVRFGWGVVGARTLDTDIAVVVDVLSFSTSVCVAVERGISVYPFPLEGRQAEEFARAHDAVLAVGRLEATELGTNTALTLSPDALKTGPYASRIVLPSPNGSTISHQLESSGASVIAGCLRNATAVADYLAERINHGDSVGIVATGELCSQEGTLRLALEDHLGAGAIFSELAGHGYQGIMSPRALTVADYFDSRRPLLSELMHACESAKELQGIGFGVDIEVASALNDSPTVPVLDSGAFQDSLRD